MCVFCVIIHHRAETELALIRLKETRERIYMIAPGRNECITFHNVDNSTRSAVDTSHGTLCVYLLSRKCDGNYFSSLVADGNNSLTYASFIRATGFRLCLRSRRVKWDAGMRFFQPTAPSFFFVLSFLLFRNIRKLSSDQSIFNEIIHVVCFA